MDRLALMFAANVVASLVGVFGLHASIQIMKNGGLAIGILSLLLNGVLLILNLGFAVSKFAQLFG